MHTVLTDASAFPKASPVWELLAPPLCARLAVIHTYTHTDRQGCVDENKDAVDYSDYPALFLQYVPRLIQNYKYYKGIACIC